MNPARAALAAFDGWFRRPVPDAAARMGLFRILYGCFYLWHLASFDLSLLAGMPEEFRRYRILLGGLAGAVPSEAGLQAIDAALVCALVLLICGVRVQGVTAVVLVVGVFREALLTGVDLENSNVMLVFAIPLFMLVGGRWDARYALDAHRAPPLGDAFLGARAVLVLLAALFSSSAVYKGFGSGTWLVEPTLLPHLMVQRSVKAALLGHASNPLAPWLAAQGWVGLPMQLGVLAFEGGFFLALLTPTLRSFFLAMAMVFHTLNATFLVVSFTPILIVYGLFVNWEALRRRVWPRMPTELPLAPPAARAGAVVAALLLAAAWHRGAHHVFDLGGWLDWRTFWWPVFPLAVVWALRSAAQLARQARAALASS